MRSVCLTALLFFPCSWGPFSVWSAHADDQSAVEKQQQLIKEQEAENLQRNSFEEFVKKNESLQTQYGTTLEVQKALRIGNDRLSQLGRSRHDRGARVWSLMDIKLPLKQPLDVSQVAELETFKSVFRDSSFYQSAEEVLKEHKRLDDIRKAEMRLAKLQLKSTADDLSEEQLSELIKIEKEFSNTRTADTAKDFLKAHFDRTALKEAGNLGLFDIETYEQLASDRLTEASRLQGKPGESLRLQVVLSEIVEDFPSTRAGREAKSQLDYLKKLTAAKDERSRSIRDYWDAVYPSRIRK